MEGLFAAAQRVQMLNIKEQGGADAIEVKLS
jgi:hypothetical protein